MIIKPRSGVTRRAAMAGVMALGGALIGHQAAAKKRAAHRTVTTSGPGSPTGSPVVLNHGIQQDGWAVSSTNTYVKAGTPWWAVNNDWNHAPAGSQVVTVYPNNFPGWTKLEWKYGSWVAGSNVGGYPQIICGAQHSNWEPNLSLGGVRPAWYGRTIGSLSRFVVSWQFSLAGDTSNFNVLSEGFPNNVETGFHLWLPPGYAANWWVNNPQTRYQATIQGVTWDFIPMYWGSGGPTLGLAPRAPVDVTVQPWLQGSFDLVPIFQYAQAQGWMVPASAVMHDWEFGNEPRSGNGSMTVISLNYDVA